MYFLVGILMIPAGISVMVYGPTITQEIAGILLASAGLASIAVHSLIAELRLIRENLQIIRDKISKP